eukprot:3184644-Heterocapsa_arctica.AAC.1
MRFANSPSQWGCARLDAQHVKLRDCVSPTKLVPPDKFGNPSRNERQKADDKEYTYELGVYKRLTVALHAAYAAVDSYLNQMGASQRVAQEDELASLSPVINSERAARLAARRTMEMRNPLPVGPVEDCMVEPQLLHSMGKYDMACLNMQKDAGGKYEYPTLVDHSIINNFLMDDH